MQFGLFWLLIFFVNEACRALIGIHPHSGYNKPPMHGDYEAQRHWMEITTNLPIEEWYFGKNKSNDLMYWGLDYPPLTAYHSYICGKLGTRVAPKAFELEKSRGFVDGASKRFMRLSVIVSDCITYIPGVLLFFGVFQGADKHDGILFALIQPALLLIDHGHFQYNGVSLGFVTLAYILVSSGDLSGDLLGSFLFVCALNFKHMTLYFAPCFFVFIASKSVRGRMLGLARIILIGMVVIASFALLWYPFLSLEQASQVLKRLFPVGRGVFEDKVANFWCSVSPVLKIKQMFAPEHLFKICAGTTLLSMTPSLALVAWKPNAKMFLYSLANTSLAFFFFAFQVHEKSILMPLLPITLIWHAHAHLVTWTTAISCFSMFPLLERDDLVVPYVGCMILLFIAGKWNFWSRLSMVPVVVIHGLMQFVAPPEKLAHLWIILCTTYSFLMFGIVFLLLLLYQYQELQNKQKND